MSIQIYQSDDAILATALTVTNVQAGALSDVLELHVWNDKGGLLAQPAANPLLVMRTQDPSDPTVRLASGVAPQDEQWGRIRVIGFNNTGDPTWRVENTDWRTLGSYGGELFATIPSNCAVHIEFAIQPPSIAEELPWVWYLQAVVSEYSQPLPAALTRVDRGILPGVGDYGHYGILSGLEVTVTSPTPDDDVHVAPGLVVIAGALYGFVSSTHQLNQNDGAASALAAGEAYWALVSVGPTGKTITKGLKAANPTKPALPAGDVFLRFARVEYEVGGTSVIETADLDGETLYDRYRFLNGGSLNLDIHPGQAHGGGTWRFAGGKQVLPLADDDVSYVWQLASGLFEATLTLTPPETTATGPWAQVTTASGVITEILDWRQYAGRGVVLHLRGDLPGSPGTLVTELAEHDRLFIEGLVYRVSDNGGGSSGSTKFDFEIDGTTIYTSSGTDDQRPDFAFDATLLTDEDGVHEVTEVRRGQVLELLSVAHPTGGTPTWAEVYLICRIP